MRIGIITLSRIKVNQGVFYNLQDIGLAEAFAEEGHEVVLYRFTNDENKDIWENGIRMIFRKALGIGKQTITGFSFLEEGMERLICFSDNQISFPGLCRYCSAKGIPLQPYVGVLYSNSPNRMVKRITDCLVERNIKEYRKRKVYVKTPELETMLHELRVMDTEVIPVCLNRRRLHDVIEQEEAAAIRERYGYQPEDKIILFVGRFEPEKEPMEMLQLFEALYRVHSDYRLLMVGQGMLYEGVKATITDRGLESVVRLEKQIANQEIWQMYGISDCFVNLNRHEIYGMSILEALYYQCPVVAMHAPGPDYIVMDGRTGYLCESTKVLMTYIEKVLEGRADIENTKKYVEERFSWSKALHQFL